MSISAANINCNHSTLEHFFNPVDCEESSLAFRVAAIALHILTLGIPYFIYQYCLERAPEAPLPPVGAIDLESDPNWWQAILDRTKSEKSALLKKYPENILKAQEWLLTSNSSPAGYRERCLKALKRHQTSHWIPRSLGMNVGGGRMCFSLKMPALAVCAGIASAKHGGLELYACHSMVAFSEKFSEIIKNENDVRSAFIVPLRGYFGRMSYPPVAQHKAVVLIEKKGKEIKVCILDSEPSSINPDQWGKDVKSFLSLGENLMINDEIPWYLLRSQTDLSKNGINCQFYYSLVKLESNNGCETFALKNGTAFLQNDNFFDEIDKLNTDGEKFPGDPSSPFKVRKIKTLPPSLMKGAQSMKLLKEYGEQYPALYKQKLPYGHRGIRTGARSLEETVEAHIYGVDTKNGKKEINLFTSDRSLKNHINYLVALEVMPTEALNELIQKHLIVAKTPDNTNNPQTIQDLHALFNDLEASRLMELP